MANFTQTISNSMRLFGGSPSSKWGDWNWNAFLWGEGTSDLPVSVVKLISNDLPTDSAVGANEIDHLISETLFPDSEMTLENLGDGSGYLYVYPSGQTNAEDRAIPSYTVGTIPSTTWASASAGSTVWS